MTTISEVLRGQFRIQDCALQIRKTLRFSYVHADVVNKMADETMFSKNFSLCPCYELLQDSDKIECVFVGVDTPQPLLFNFFQGFNYLDVYILN